MSNLARVSAGNSLNRMLGEVREGLSRAQKELSPKFFYDRRGSELFEEITRLPEYYLTRAEREILDAWMPALIGRLRPSTLIELGAGAAAKTRIILDAMRDAGSGELYVPVDVSADFLEESAARLRADYPGLRVVPWIADIGTAYDLPQAMPRPALFAFLGSTIGNFDPTGAVTMLRRVRASMRGDDRFLLGTDLVKDPAIIEGAYNDARGVTAAFNKNVLRVLNRELGARFDLDSFEHRAFYDRARHRIEMHLVSTRPQRVTIPGAGVVSFGTGESIRTEISCKYDRDRVQDMLSSAGLRLDEWTTDSEVRFALSLASCA
jgi:L-histidine N-alpha-methyltransferase